MERGLTLENSRRQAEPLRKTHVMLAGALGPDDDDDDDNDDDAGCTSVKGHRCYGIF